MVSNKDCKEHMAAYLKKHNVPVHPWVDNDSWGEGAQVNAWRVSTHAHLHPSAQKTLALVNLLFPPDAHQLFRRRLESAYDALLGTKEGSAKQKAIAAYCGLSDREPWCAETFTYAAHEAGYAGPWPSNRAYVPAWEMFARAHDLIVPRSSWLPGMGITFVWDFKHYVGSGDHIGCLSDDGEHGVHIKYGTNVPTDEGNAGGPGGDAVRSEVRPIECVNVVFDLARLVK